MRKLHCTYLFFFLLFSCISSFAKSHTTTNNDSQALLIANSMLPPISYTPNSEGILYVKKGETGLGDSWNNAIGELADALKFAKNNNAMATNSKIKQIWVAGGTYKPLYSADDTNFGNPDNYKNTFLMVKDVTLYGGFSGNETALAQRNLDIAANKSILSGTVYHILISVNDVGSALIDGFTISKIKEGPLASSTIGGNYIVSLHGGGMFNYNSSPGISNCNFLSNLVDSLGGAIYNVDSSPNITNCNFTLNGALYGGAIFNSASSSPIIFNCKFSANSSDNAGGAMGNDDASSPKIYNSLFVNNKSSSYNASAIWHDGGTDALLINCNLYGNTVVKGLVGGAINTTSGKISVYNSLLWDNQPKQYFEQTPITFKNSLIQGNTNTSNGNLDATNISTAQIFNDALNKDFTLKPGSPAINTGDNNLYNDNGGNLTTNKDLGNNPRLKDSSIDIGPYEAWSKQQTITAADMVKTYGDIPFVPTATASSGLEVSYVSADNSIAEAFQDSADGNKWKLKIKKTGQVDITAKQAGNEIYNPAPDVIFKLTTNKAPLTITADAKSKEFGTADPILTFTANGFVNGDTQAVILGALRRAIGETIGTYPIAQGTLTAANYTISYTGADFTITNAPGDFITVWDMTKASSNVKIKVTITTLPSPNNLVKYFWTTPNGNSGVGTVTTSGDIFINAPSNQPTITLHIKPENLAAVVIFNDPRLIDVAQWGTAAWQSMQNGFLKCSNLNITATDIPDLSRVTNMRAMFADCISLTGPANIGNWNTSNVTNMTTLYSGASVFNQDIGNWDTRNVTLMPYMFREARSFNQNIGNWNTSNVTSMEGMFENATNFNQNIGSWNTANVTNMAKMFYMALIFNQNIGNWNTANVTGMGGMFYSAYAFNANIGNWDTANVTNMGGMFSFTEAFNQNIGNWNTAQVTNMGSMFWGAQVFNQNISSWNTANVTNMEGMFRNNPTFNQDIGNWNTANVTSMENMFHGAQSFNQNIGDWQLNPAVNMTNMLSESGLDCANYSATLKGWADNPNTPSGRTLGAMYRQYGTSALAARTLLTTTKGWTITGDSPSGNICGRPFVTVWDMNMFVNQNAPTSLRFGITTLPNKPVSYTWTSSGGSSGSGTLTTNNSAEITGLPAGEIITLSIASEIKAINIRANSNNHIRRLINITQWGDAAWSSMDNAFNDCVNLNVTATDIPDLSAVSSMRNMFNNCQSKTGPANIGSWNTANVTNMEGLFGANLVFDQDISSWNTANVTNMGYMLSAARTFNQDLSNWNTSNVTNMEGMFQGTRASNLNISNWDTQNVTNMKGMFALSPVFNEDISNWNTSKVTNMSNMFGGSQAFNQNISSWNTAAVTNMSEMFANATSFNQPIGNWNTASVNNMFLMFASAKNFNQDIGNWNTSAVTNMSGMFDSATAFNKPIGNWNITSVTDMHGMFNRTSSFNQDLSHWNISSVLRLGYMFVQATAFNQNIGSWQLNPNADMTSMLDFSGMDCTNYSLTLQGWANNPNIPTGRNLGASYKQYGTNAETARNFLINTKGWTITGDSPSGQNCALSQTITAADMVKTYGDAAFVPTATASSGLEVSYVSTDNSIAEAFQDTADGNKWKLKIKKAGIVNIRAQQAGNETYNAATDVIFKLTINKAALTITANALSKEYGTADPALTYTVTGFANGDDQTVITGNLTRAAGEAIGTYAIAQGTLASDNYDITFTGTNFTITAATGDFVTVWDMSKPGDSNKIIFYPTISPGTSVAYFWTASGGSTGSGTIPAGVMTRVVISNLPTNEMITLNIKPDNFKAFSFAVNSAYSQRLVDITQWGTDAWSTMKHAFYGAENLVISATDIPNLDQVTDMSGIFSGCRKLTGPANIDSWNTTNVTNMSRVFFSATTFNQNISSWNTQNVTYMDGMFSGARAFNQNIGTWNTANVTDMSSMFYEATAFNQNIGAWNTANVTSMGGMFTGAEAFNQDIGSWNTTNVTDMSYMFTSAITFNQNINGWDTQNVTKMTGMFWNAKAFNQNIATWNTTNVNNMAGLFSGATAFNQDISSWNTENVINIESMFAGASTFNQNIGNWELNPVVNMSNMLDNSGLDCQNYSLTLQGWAANPNTPSGRNLGAQSRQYGTNAEAARTALTTTKGWTITGDSPSGQNCGLSQTITASDMTKTYGDIPFVPTATASSGLEVSYVSADNSIAEAFQDSADGNKWKLKINKTGVVNITAKQAGNDTYAPAADVIFTLTINKAALTITANAHSKIYGTTDPTLTYVVNGLVNGDTETVISGSLTRAAGENIGTYAIEQGTISAENYVITYIGADLNITKATLNIVADAKSKAFGTTDPSLTYTVTGFVNGDTESIITGSLSRAVGEAVGIYAITQGTLSAGNNYEINFTEADFTIIEMLVVDTSTQTNVTCNGGSDGSATVSITGGTAPYTYSWSPNGGTTATATGLASGDYTVTVTDANGSSITKDFNITQPQAVEPPTAEDVQEFCRAANPTISDLEIVGTQVRWYASATAIQELPDDTLLVDGTIYYASQTINGCESQERTLVIITLNDQLPTPQGAPIQDLEEGATIADLVVTPSNVVWYASYDDAVNNSNPLSPTTELENGTTYYAIAMANGQCSSLPFAVTVNVTLEIGKPQKTTFKYYPNPVEDYLNIENSGIIEKIEVYSMLGQLVKKQDCHSVEVKLFLGDLPDGTYAVSILSEGKKSTVKVIKK